MLTDNEFDRLMRLDAVGTALPQMPDVRQAVITRIASSKVVSLLPFTKAAWYAGVAAAAMLFFAFGVDHYAQNHSLSSDPSLAVYSDIDDSLELSWNNP